MTIVKGRMDASLTLQLEVLKIDQTAFRKQPYMIILVDGVKHRVYEGTQLNLELDMHYDHNDPYNKRVIQ